VGPTSHASSEQGGGKSDFLIFLDESSGHRCNCRGVRATALRERVRRGPKTLDPAHVYGIEMLIITMLELRRPSFALNRNESAPVAPTFGV